MRHRTNLFMTAVGCRIPKEDRSSSIVEPSELGGAGGQLPSQICKNKTFLFNRPSISSGPSRFSEFPKAINSSTIFFLLLFSFHHFYHCSLQENWVMRSSPRKTEQNSEQKSSGGGSTSGPPSNHCALHSITKARVFKHRPKIMRHFSSY